MSGVPKKLAPHGELTGVLSGLMREGDIEVVEKEGGDAFKLTDKGFASTLQIIKGLMEGYDKMKDKEGMVHALAAALEKHGVCCIAGFGCDIARIRKDAGPYFYELRFRFMGGNKELQAV
mgnify:CR=1 FL=1